MPPKKKVGAGKGVEEKSVSTVILDKTPTLVSGAKTPGSDKIEEIYGDLMELLESEDEFVPSGSLIVDSVVSNGKGLPLGRFISINSESGIGKTSLALHLARNFCSKGVRCLYIDTEVGLNRNQLESFSMMQFVENHTFIPKYMRTYRELDDLLKSALADPGLKFVFIDSLTDLTTDQVCENNVADMNTPALDARMQGQILKKYKYLYHKAGKTIFFILQNRTKIGMNWGERTTVEAAGGKAVLYHMDITLELIKKETLKKTLKGHTDPIPYGSECVLRSNKNRHAPSMIPMPIQIIFGKGISNAASIAKALILNKIVKQPSARLYLVPFKEGEEFKFTSRGAYEDFIKDNIMYYKEIVDGCGGIVLLQETDD